MTRIPGGGKSSRVKVKDAKGKDIDERRKGRKEEEKGGMRKRERGGDVLVFRGGSVIFADEI